MPSRRGLNRGTKGLEPDRIRRSTPVGLRSGSLSLVEKSVPFARWLCSRWRRLIRSLGRSLPALHVAARSIHQRVIDHGAAQFRQDLQRPCIAPGQEIERRNQRGSWFRLPYR